LQGVVLVSAVAGGVRLAGGCNRGDLGVSVRGVSSTVAGACGATCAYGVTNCRPLLAGVYMMLVIRAAP
jgi:hypothetical protein